MEKDKTKFNQNTKWGLMKKYFRRLFEASLRGKTVYILKENNGIKSITFEKPVSIEIFPSLECNVNCASCDRGVEKSQLEDFNDIKILRDNLSKDINFNMLNFIISGREPTLYPKVNELIVFLRRLDPFAEIEFFTNAIELKQLTRKSLAAVKLAVSIYPKTHGILQKDKFIVDLFKSRGLSLKVNTRFHEDLSRYGATQKDFSPFLRCFAVVLLCGTRKVYPCCRAHKLEQMRKKKYHLCVNTENLYEKLKNMIKDTDLCSHCPRIYSDYGIMAT